MEKVYLLIKYEYESPTYYRAVFGFAEFDLADAMREIFNANDATRTYDVKEIEVWP